MVIEVPKVQQTANQNQRLSWILVKACMLYFFYPGVYEVQIFIQVKSRDGDFLSSLSILNFWKFSLQTLNFRVDLDFFHSCQSKEFQYRVSEIKKS